MWCVMVTPPSPQQITLGDIFSDFHSKYSVDPPSQSHSLTLTHAHTHTYAQGYYNPHAHVFCDCDVCQAQWGGMDFSDIIGSDSDLFSDEDDDCYFAFDADDRSKIIHYYVHTHTQVTSVDL